jgi:hypothetical protein
VFVSTTPLIDLPEVRFTVDQGDVDYSHNVGDVVTLPRIRVFFGAQVEPGDQFFSSQYAFAQIYTLGSSDLSWVKALPRLFCDNGPGTSMSAMFSMTGWTQTDSDDAYLGQARFGDPWSGSRRIYIARDGDSLEIKGGYIRVVRFGGSMNIAYSQQANATIKPSYYGPNLPFDSSGAQSARMPVSDVHIPFDTEVTVLQSASEVAITPTLTLIDRSGLGNTVIHFADATGVQLTLTE